MKNLLRLAGAGACSIAILASGQVLAADPNNGNGASSPSTLFSSASTLLGPTSTQQPNQSCQSFDPPQTPGNSATAPGSAFNTDGKSGTVYAGTQPQNSNNTASVSQYDVACSKQPPQ
jgi:hypothetical protein